MCIDGYNHSFLLLILLLVILTYLFIFADEVKLKLESALFFRCLANYHNSTNKTALVAVFFLPVGFLRKHIKPQWLANEIDSWVNLTQSCGRTHAAKLHIGASLLKLLEALAMINMYRAPAEQHITGSLSVCWTAQVFLSLVVVPTDECTNLF